MTHAAPTYRVARFSRNDERVVAEFQELLWQGGASRNLAYLRWKYGRNPYLDDRYVLLGWSGDELRGMLGAFGARWQATNGEQLTIPCVSDTLIAPADRGGPLFFRLLDELVDRLDADGLPWLMDFGDQGAAPAMLMRGWRLVGPWPFATIRREQSIPQSAWTTPAHGPALRGVRSGVPMHATLATPDGAAIDAMVTVAAALPSHGVRHVVDAGYLAWRFDNPLARYHYLTAGDARLEGFLIVHRTQVDAVDGDTPTTIVDCEAVSDEIWIDLVEAAVARAPGGTLLMWARDYGSRRLALLEAAGFTMDVPSGRLTRDWHLPHLLLRATAAQHPTAFAKLESSSAWDLRSICGRCWR